MKLRVNKETITQGSLKHCLNELIDICQLDTGDIKQARIVIKETGKCLITWGADEFVISEK